MTRTFEMKRTEVDGIPTFWADTPPGRYVAMLQFRVGRADEPAPWGGITHLVEHLALAPLTQQRYDHNGVVEGVRTIFLSVGDPEDAVDFFAKLSDSFAALDLDRLLMERRILLREAEQSGGPGVGGALRALRFGLLGQGALGLGEFGLGWLGPEAVRQWAAERFTRGNAALVLSGPPPAGLRIRLPDGPRQATPTPRSLGDVAWPAHLTWDGPGVTLSMLMPRLPESNMLMNVAQRRARQSLRFEQGLVYDVMPDYEPLDGNTAHVVVGADVPDSDLVPVSRALVEVLDRLAADGPTPDELALEVDGFRRQFNDRDAQIGFLDVAAADHLYGGHEREPDEILANRERVTPDQAAATLRSSLESLLLLAGGPPYDGRFSPYPPGSPSAVDGREYKPAGFHLPGRGPRERLVAGPDGVSVKVDGDFLLTVRFRDCRVVEHPEDRGRILWAEDGTRVAVAADAWRGGDEVISAIDAALPAEVVACDEHGVGALADHTGSASAVSAAEAAGSQRAGTVSGASAAGPAAAP